MMAPTLLNFGLLLLAQLHLTWALVPRASATSSLASNQPQQTGTAINCAQFETVVKDQTCDSFQNFGLDRDQFKALNPQINKECKNLIAGERYCVKLAVSSSSSIDTSAKTTLATATAMTTMTTVTKTTTTSSATSSVAVVTPIPFQTGMVNNCIEFWYVTAKDTCYSIAQARGKTVGDITKWNPGVKEDCSELWLHNNICTGVSA
ncbi:hypothetical protein N5P37_004499 [Trichoderma harzianum]|uniref:Carbohydrate-binding module family 50 protein n=1 Tax=Trichoderma harzianum CBS 226.95 TaxID=983964 RepID=A0A2T3ZS70_TRIHA|nr:carbohydrate-binding module family 50 protein [Trichoderma harzianum CBS 226.95]KAK0762973.1 hypothetical protein N5P37_004499 [Trichoderma harzianum]PTB47663.1 carbohydrate-binding module family 50 protein [Trichoderma harzianum CBS 226.95]